MLREANKARRVNSHTNAIGCLVPMFPAREIDFTPMDNTQLIRAARQGDTAAFEQLVHQYDQAVLRVAIHLTGSAEDGQDIYQEAFLRAYLKLPRFRFECSFYTWIYRIVVNLCLDHLRRKRLRYRYSTVLSGSDGKELDLIYQVPDERAIASPERNFAAHVHREHIVRALDKLTPRERTVFELKHYHGMQLKTVAGILNTTEGTVRNTLFRATHKLRAQLAEVR
jgi:RNA polymerase sigma-70 factor, ECF subfamily